MRADIQLRQEAAADDAAGDEHAIADGEFSKQEAAAEQFCFDAARAVIEDDGHQRESAPAFVEVHDTADDDRLAVALAQVRDRDRRAPIAVCARDVREQLVGRGDAEFRELGRSLRTDARQRADRKQQAPHADAERVKRHDLAIRREPPEGNQHADQSRHRERKYENRRQGTQEEKSNTASAAGVADDQVHQPHQLRDEKYERKNGEAQQGVGEDFAKDVSVEDAHGRARPF